jgi:predicted RNA-binding Zn ribbon-like protein
VTERECCPVRPERLPDLADQTLRRFETEEVPALLQPDEAGQLRVAATPPDAGTDLRWAARRATGAGPGRVLVLVPRILGAVLTAVADGTWSRMKACAAQDCQYAFYDHTRNRSARWCDVAGCGVRARMRSYRRRHAP